MSTAESVQVPSAVLNAINRQAFGNERFRPGQEEAIQRIVSTQQDSILVAYTGFGKSRVYQVAALCMHPGTLIIVQPLLSLMRDQLQRLLDLKISSVMYHGGLKDDTRKMMCDVVQHGVISMLFISPELLVGEDACQAMLTSLHHLHNQQRLSGVVVDEAHLCKEWIDFRGGYAQLFRVRKDFPGVPFHAFTATATSDQGCNTTLFIGNAKDRHFH